MVVSHLLSMIRVPRNWSRIQDPFGFTVRGKKRVFVPTASCRTCSQLTGKVPRQRNKLVVSWFLSHALAQVRFFSEIGQYMLEFTHLSDAELECGLADFMGWVGDLISKSVQLDQVLALKEEGACHVAMLQMLGPESWYQ